MRSFVLVAALAATPAAAYAQSADTILVNGKVVSSSHARLRLLPMAGVSLDFGHVRLDYAYQVAIQQSIDSQHRVLVAFTF